MNNKIELIFCESGDWAVLKLNGKVYEEGHSIPDYIWLKLLQELGNETTSKVISDENMEDRNF